MPINDKLRVQMVCIGYRRKEYRRIVRIWEFEWCGGFKRIFWGQWLVAERLWTAEGDVQGVGLDRGKRWRQDGSDRGMWQSREIVTILRVTLMTFWSKMGTWSGSCRICLQIEKSINLNKIVRVWRSSGSLSRKDYENVCTAHCL